MTRTTINFRSYKALLQIKITNENFSLIFIALASRRGRVKYRKKINKKIRWQWANYFHIDIWTNEFCFNFYVMKCSRRMDFIQPDIFPSFPQSLARSRKNIRKTKNLRDNFSQRCTYFFYRQLDFSSEPGVAYEILENEPQSCLTVA